MSATELFSTPDDVRFRLVGTFLIINNSPFNVIDVSYNDFRDLTGVSLIGKVNGEVPFAVPLHKLSVRTMSFCPSGYLGEAWLCRGPNRNRFQGITSGDLFAIGDVDFNLGILPTILTTLLKQPRVRPHRAQIRPGKPVTNEILVTKDHEVLYRGNYIGDRNKSSSVRLAIPEPPEILTRALTKARLVYE